MNVMSKAEMKKVLGGFLENLCANKTGLELKECYYQACMKGWVKSQNTEQDNKDKLDTCYKMAGLPG